MKDKTKRRVSNTITIIAGVYGLVGLVHVLPVLMAWVHPALSALSTHFLLIPFGAILALATVVIPMVLLVVAIFGVAVVTYKLMGLELDI